MAPGSGQYPKGLSPSLAHSESHNSSFGRVNEWNGYCETDYTSTIFLSVFFRLGIFWQKMEAGQPIISVLYFDKGFTHLP